MKNMYELSNLQSTKAPEELKQRTLLAARQVRREEQENTPQHLTAAPAPRRRMPWLRRTLAAVCALAVVLGGTKLLYHPADGNVIDPATVLANTFGFVAYAADTGEMMEPKDSKIVFNSGSGADDLENGFFSGCLFKVTGENIKTVSATMDKGSLYRAKRIEIAEQDITPALREGKSPAVQGADQVSVWGVGDEEIDRWFADLGWKLENGFTEPYDPDASYGFWAPTVSEIADEDDLQQAWHDRVDTFDGAKLTVTVTFTDDTTQTQTMHLKTGKLACEYIDDVSGPQLTGEVLTDAQAAEQGYLYGVYAEIA